MLLLAMQVRGIPVEYRRFIIGTIAALTSVITCNIASSARFCTCQVSLKFSGSFSQSLTAPGVPKSCWQVITQTSQKARSCWRFLREQICNDPRKAAKERPLLTLHNFDLRKPLASAKADLTARDWLCRISVLVFKMACKCQDSSVFHEA